MTDKQKEAIAALKAVMLEHDISIFAPNDNEIEITVAHDYVLNLGIPVLYWNEL